ncbi:MAG TPA: type II CAAX endopeptidase family protein [Thermoguttaceae bacterium]|nr:type II CAAX endopeptidase family protein [Thermoguttaceae bacterium]
MKTPIGLDLRGKRRLCVVYAVVAVVVVLLEFGSASRVVQPWWLDLRAVLAAFVLLAFVLPGNVSRESLGLRLTPIQPICYWVRFTVLIAAAMLVIILICTDVVHAMGLPISIHKTPPDHVVVRLLSMCLYAPLVEELIFRFAICVPATAILGPVGAILLSGSLFAAIHFTYGNPGPDNFVAGFILAWAYLKSGSILVPMTLHALGNSVAWAAQTLAWHVV